MAKYFTKRVLELIPKILVITVIVFAVLQMLPGDALSRTIPPIQYNQMSEVQKEAMRESMGLNDPYYIQFVRWFGNLLKGDFGYSQSTGSNIFEMLKNRLPATIELTLLALIIAGVFGIFFGFIASLKQNSPLDYINTTASIVGISIPDFSLVFFLFLFFPFI